MFSTFLKECKHDDRKVPEVVLNGKGVFITIIILILYQFVIAYPLSYGIQWFNAQYSAGLGFYINEAGLNFALDMVALMLMLFFFGQFYWENLKNLFKDFKALYLWFPLVCYFATMVGNIIMNIVLFILRGDAEQTSNNVAVGDMLTQNPGVMIVTVVFLAPIVEETIFRAGLCRPMTASKNYLIKFAGYFLSVSIFALLHVYQFAFLTVTDAGTIALTFNLYEFLSILSYIPMALAFAICASVSKNFWVSVGLHMLNNGIAVGYMILMSMLQNIIA